MDIKQLEIFSVLASTLHFAKAAKLCHMTAPALTRSIQRLEQELGVTLLLRNNRMVSLTPAGQRVLLFAESAIESLHILEKDLRSDEDQLQGELRVFGSVTASYSVLSSLLPVFRQDYPGVDLKLITGDQASAIDKVAAREVDVAIAARPDKLPKNMLFKTLSYSPLVFIMPAQANAPVALQVAEMQGGVQWVNPAKLPMIIPDQGLTRDRFDAWMKETRQSANIYATVTGHEAIVSMVALGLGVGLVPDVVIQHSPMHEQIKVVRGAPELKAFQIGLCILEAQLKLPTLRAFWDNANLELMQMKYPV